MMNEIISEEELKKIIELGEDSYTQFKQEFISIDSLAAEITAFLNSNGGRIIVGVSDNGKIIGLSKNEIKKMNQWIANACTNKIEPVVIRVLTNIKQINGKTILIIYVPQGINKFYMANNRDVWVKVGSDKRRAGREELKRLLQESKNIYADEQPIDGTSLDDFDLRLFREFYRKRTDDELEESEENIIKILNNLKIMSGNELTMAGVLLFAKYPSEILPPFIIKGVYYRGKNIADQDYIDSRDIKGNVVEMFKEGRSFILSNIKHKQEGQNFNSTGIPEIPRVAIEEALINALLHRNYFMASNIRIFILDNRVEIISPGLLPNTATIGGIKMGLHIERNPILVSLIRDMDGVPYRGVGTGVRRIMKSCEERDVKIEFIEEKETEEFKVVFYR